MHSPPPSDHADVMKKEFEKDLNKIVEPENEN